MKIKHWLVSFLISFSQIAFADTVLDEVSKTANLFNVQAIPTKVVIDKNGNIVFNGFGEIEKHIERSLKN